MKAPPIGGAFRVSIKCLAEFAAAAANKVKSFSAATCAWRKIHLRLHVCELCAYSAQGVR